MNVLSTIGLSAARIERWRWRLHTLLDKRMYVAFIAGIAAANAFLPFFPVELFLVLRVVVRRKSWWQLTWIAALSSGLGNLALAFLVDNQHQPEWLPWLESHLGPASWNYVRALVAQRGPLGLGLVALSFLPLPPAVVVCALLKVPYWQIVLPIIASHCIKYGCFARMAALAPHWFSDVKRTKGQEGRSCKTRNASTAGILHSLFFRWTSELTTRFPQAGAALLDRPISAIVGSRSLETFFLRRNQKTLRKVRGIRRILVHPDIHIGDAVMAQASVSALRDFFPNAEIDFIVGKSISRLLEHNPEISRVLPMYEGGEFPSRSELDAVSRFINEGNYDICINANPFLEGKAIAEKCPTFDFTSHAPFIARNERLALEPNHIVFQHHRFIYRLFGPVYHPNRERTLSGVSVGLPDSALKDAGCFLDSLNARRPFVLLNSDTASPYTRVPFEHQVGLATRLLQSGTTLLVGAGHSALQMGEQLIEAISPELRINARLIPRQMALETFAALSDACDLFISGDTGPMHIAAAKKYSITGNYSVKNRTAVLCLFGATPSRLSGYDSFQRGYLPSNQDAPSWTVVAESRCRNITCVNKLYKTCRIIRCFEGLDVAKVYDGLAWFLEQRGALSRT